MSDTGTGALVTGGGRTDTVPVPVAKMALNGQDRPLLATLVIVALQFSATESTLGVNVAVAVPSVTVAEAGVIVPQPDTANVTMPENGSVDDVTVALIADGVGEDTDPGAATSQTA